MQHWSAGPVTNLLFLATLLLIAAGLRRNVSFIQKMALPDSMMAGMMGLALGPSGLAVIPFQLDLLETIVYHSLALVFIAVGLQNPVEGKATGGARSMAFGIPILAVVQGILGLIIVLIWSVSIEKIHPGFAMLLPLGFSQGPGQALSVGQSFDEGYGLKFGGQLGIIYAALGFAWCCFIGVPLVLYARKKGWVDDPGRAGAGEEATVPIASPEGSHPLTSQPAPPGAMDPLTFQLVVIGGCYAATFAVLQAMAGALESKPKAVALVWGFHFIIASFVAMGVRGGVKRFKMHNRLDDGLLGRLAGVIVDVSTAAALAAVRIEVLATYWAPILVITVAGGVVTLIVSIWLARRAFPSAPFEHALVLYGTSTGTLPTGLALLRILDPDFKGPVATSTVLGAAGAMVMGVPLFPLLFLPMTDWPNSFPNLLLVTIAIDVVYIVVLAVAWRYAGPLRYMKPLHTLWPPDRH